MSTIGFLYRDILKYIIPTLLFFILFASLFEVNININNLISFGIIASLVVGSLLSFFSTRLFKIFPKYKDFENRSKWMDSNWDHSKAFFYLSNDDRNYLHLTRAYIDFYKHASLVILLFMISLIVKMIFELKDNFCEYCCHTTNFIFGLKINSIILFLICFSFFWALKTQVISGLKNFCLLNGQLETFSEKAQKECQILFAKRIYGIIEGGSGVDLKLLYKNNVEAICKTDEHGHWGFNLKEKFLIEKHNLKIQNNDKTIDKEIRITLNNKPYYEFKF